MSERLVDVSRIGKRTLDLVASTVRLQNRTNDTTYKLSPEGLERWKRYFEKDQSAYGVSRNSQRANHQGKQETDSGCNDSSDISSERKELTMFGNTQQGGGGKSPWTRLTGLFPTRKGGWIGRIEVKQFPAVIAVMKEAHAKGGTLTLLIQPDRSGKPAISMTAGDAYQKQQDPTEGRGMFEVPAPQPAPQQQAREVSFGKADVPKDSFDSLLESL